MECSIYDPTLTRKGVFFEVVSLIWTEEYNSIGNLQLVLNKTPRAIELLRVGNFVGLRGRDVLMRIKSVQDTGNTLWAYGSTASELLSYRVCNEEQTYTNVNAETFLLGKISSTRTFNIVTTNPATGLTATTSTSTTYNTLRDVVETVCEDVEYGYRLRHDKEAHKLVFEVYEGVDRSKVKLSLRYGNLWSINRDVSDANYRNVAYIKGKMRVTITTPEGEEKVDRYVYTTAGDTGSTGLARRELYVNASDVQYEDGMSEAAFTTALQKKGLEVLLEYAKADDITLEIDPQNLGKRFSLGDKVTCLLPEYDNLALVVRIIAFTETFENNDHTVELELGKPVIRERRNKA